MTTATLPINGWMAPARAALDSYRRTSDHMLDIALPFESFARDERSREFARLANRSARARAGVLREWTLAPLWWSGMASPSDLHAEVQNAAAIDRDLVGAWDELLRARTSEVADTVRETVELATAPAADLNAVVVDAVRTAALATQSLGQPENLNAAAVEAVRAAASSSAAVREMAELGDQLLDETADTMLAGAQAATLAAQDGATLHSGLVERTGDSEEFAPATAVSPADETAKAAAAGRRTARKGNEKPA